MLVPGSGPQSNAKAYVIIKGFTDRISADPSALEIMQQIDRMFGDVIPRQACRLEGPQRNVTDLNSELLDVNVTAHTILPAHVAEAWAQGRIGQLLQGEALRRYDLISNSIRMSSGTTRVTLTIEPRVTDAFAKSHMCVIRIVNKDNQANWSFNEASQFLSVTLNTNRVSDPSASLKLLLGAQPTKSPELNANNKVPPALVLNLKLEPVRLPSSQPGGTGSYAGAAPGDSLARAAVLFKVAKPITGTWALQDPGTYAIRSIEQVRPG